MASAVRRRADAAVRAAVHRSLGDLSAAESETLRGLIGRLVPTARCATRRDCLNATPRLGVHPASPWCHSGGHGLRSRPVGGVRPRPHACLTQEQPGRLCVLVGCVTADWSGGTG